MKAVIYAIFIEWLILCMQLVCLKIRFLVCVTRAGTKKSTSFTLFRHIPLPSTFNLFHMGSDKKKKKTWKNAYHVHTWRTRTCLNCFELNQNFLFQNNKRDYDHEQVKTEIGKLPMLYVYTSTLTSKKQFH